MGFIILCITTFLGYEIGHHFIPEYEVLSSIIGFIFGLCILSGTSGEFISSASDTFTSFDSGD